MRPMPPSPNGGEKGVCGLSFPVDVCARGVSFSSEAFIYRPRRNQQYRLCCLKTGQQCTMSNFDRGRQVPPTDKSTATDTPKYSS